MLEINQIHHGDCLELMSQIPDHSIDMILGDNPYNTTACAWDSIIPLEPLWAHYKRLIKPRGAIVLTASQPFTSMLVMSNLEWFKYEWIWIKDQVTNPQLAKVMPLKNYESILTFGNNGAVVYNPQGLKKVNNRRKPDSAGKRLGHLSESKFYTQEFSSYPKMVIKFNSERGLHPTQKPVALFAYLIRTYTNPGDLVLDNAAGSGTTAIAAIDTGRNWLCIEKSPDYSQPISDKNPDYYGIAKERIEKRLLQPFLPEIEEQPKPEQKQLFDIIS